MKSIVKWIRHTAAQYCQDRMADIRLIDPFMKNEELTARYLKYAEWSRKLLKVKAE